ncbi:hypothetical protein LIER_13303 [Lithospermum erythrorhizon]|uniref:Uncharacterized protein n=1 Tax=Lithospermum erythrorhizon TaxID=34254 RepID=A0AAV3PUY9_LITER
MVDQVVPSVGNANQVPQNQNQNTSETIITEQRVQVDTPGPSQQRPGIPPMMPPIDQYPVEDILEEVQQRVRLVREREVQRQVDVNLGRDRLVHEERDRLVEKETHAEQEHRARESYHTNDPPYTPTYSPRYTSSMLPEYGHARTTSYRPSVVNQTDICQWSFITRTYRDSEKII